MAYGYAFTGSLPAILRVLSLSLQERVFKDRKDPHNRSQAQVFQHKHWSKIALKHQNVKGWGTNEHRIGFIEGSRMKYTYGADSFRSSVLPITNLSPVSHHELQCVSVRRGQSLNTALKGDLPVFCRESIDEGDELS